jgi:DNA polymerase III alpha subunit (gram-positive type)
MLTKLKVLNINTIDQINIELQNNNLYKSQFPSYCQLYAKNQAGLKEIYTIVSTSSTDTYFGHPKAFSTDIYNMKNIIKASSPYDGDV